MGWGSKIAALPADTLARARAARGRTSGVIALGGMLLLAGCSLLSRVGPPPAPEIAVLLSDESRANQKVARELVRQNAGHVRIYRLDPGDPQAPSLRLRLERSRASVVVAIGPAAAGFAARLSGKQVVFCQVFDYERAGLPAPGMRGVSATPPVIEQFRYLKRLYPGLRRIGVVTGPGPSALLAEATAAARAQGLALVHAQASNDKEMLFAYREMAPRVQGFWLLPDERILSVESVRELLSFSVRAGIPTLVFTQKLLGYGALLSAESVPADVAARVLNIVRGPAEAPGASAAVLPLTCARIRINTTIAGLLELPLAPGLREFAYAP